MFNNIWLIPDIRQKSYNSILLIIIYRIMTNVSAFPIDCEVIISKIYSSSFTEYLYAIFAAGALDHYSFFTLGILPISFASGINSLSVRSRVPFNNKKGERFLTLVVSLLMSTMLFNITLQTTNDYTLYTLLSFFKIKLYIIIGLATGSMTLLFLSNLFNGHTVVHPHSLIILSNLSYYFSKNLLPSQVSFFSYIIIPALVIPLLFYINYCCFATRRIPIQTPKKVIGARIYGGQSTILPIKLLDSQILPSSIIGSFVYVLILRIIIYWISDTFKLNALKPFLSYFTETASFPGFIGMVCSIALLYYLSTTQHYNSISISDNLKRSGGFIPGIRPGYDTARFLEIVISRITFASIIIILTSLALIVLIGRWLYNLLGINLMFFRNPTLLFILLFTYCSQFINIIENLESYLRSRNYEGFIRRTPLRRYL